MVNTLRTTESAVDRSCLNAWLFMASLVLALNLRGASANLVSR
jgi:hypothetical protein